MTTMHISTLVILVGASLILATPEEPCVTPNRLPGVCLALPSCASLKNLLQSTANDREQRKQTIDFLRKSQCSFQDRYPSVCCPTGPDGPSGPIAQPPAPSQTESDGPAGPLSVVDVSNHPNVHLINSARCGKGLEDRIFNGNKTELFEFPWMVLLRYKTSAAHPYLCDGSLINDRYVLTAAHCIRGTEFPPIAVRLGEHEIDNTRECVDAGCKAPPQDIPVETIVVHPKYMQGEMHYYFDIALLRMTHKADISQISALPICLPVGKAQYSKLDDKKVIVAGWGVTEKTPGLSKMLMKVSLPVVNTATCNHQYTTLMNADRGINERQICAGGGKEDSCSGDSGGPLIRVASVGSEPRNVQFGIVSYGTRECGSGMPGVYTNVVYYMRWILDTIRN